jgi:hypothetical protein
MALLLAGVAALTLVIPRTAGGTGAVSTAGSGTGAGRR